MESSATTTPQMNSARKFVKFAVPRKLIKVPDAAFDCIPSNLPPIKLYDPRFKSGKLMKVKDPAFD
jgi:hypothetical protein